MTVTINVTEGERYVVSSVKLEGDYLDKEDEFKSLVAIQAGEAYNAEEVEHHRQGLHRLLYGALRLRLCQRRGGAGGRPGQQPCGFRAAWAARRGACTCGASTSQGNNRTRDEVIRREFRQLESSWYDGEKIAFRVTAWTAWVTSPSCRCRHPEVPGRARSGRPERVSMARKNPPATSRWAPDTRTAERPVASSLRHQAGKRLRFGQLPGPATVNTSKLQPPRLC
jgi:hypothetical protein